ncbi:tumor protein D53 isoform X5 [Periophthalmus magnuspinnatus]|uniref:tumor protein D53 isoform X5 n=1 Tax=Periophthalmus magnuspinnatus TaxID=409849 RepID=UPI0024366B83|nr:tumor protein D53 isoform X5 [Periophthalmus magnuspinnatus]
METRQQEQYSSVLSEAVLDWASMGPDGEWVNSDPHEGPQDRGHLSAGLDSQPLRETDEDLASEINLSNSIMTEEEREEIQQELAKLEEEISTLKQVLTSKEKQHAELKEKLGLTPLGELRNNFSRGWQDMTNSTAYKKTSETLSTAGQKTTAAFNTLGTAITRKLGDMRQRLEGQDLEEALKTFCHLQQTQVTRTHPPTA